MGTAPEKRARVSIAPGSQARQGVKLDIIPAGKELLEQGFITWKSGHVMSLEGMDLAFSHAQAHDIAGGFVIHVAPPAVVTVLKMASYCDRPSERERDLEDIAYLLDTYVDEESQRRWDEAGEVEEFELAPAYLLGLDIGGLANESHRALISRFLDRVADPDSVEHAEMQRRGAKELEYGSRCVVASPTGVQPRTKLGTSRYRNTVTWTLVAVPSRVRLHIGSSQSWRVKIPDTCVDCRSRLPG